MSPIVPPSVIRDLAIERYQEVSAVTQRRATDLDQVFIEEALAPDPVFMGLRALVASGPIGRLMRAIDRRIEEREERRYGATASARESSIAEFQHRDRTDIDIAA